MKQIMERHYWTNWTTFCIVGSNSSFLVPIYMAASLKRNRCGLFVLPASVALCSSAYHFCECRRLSVRAEKALGLLDVGLALVYALCLWTQSQPKPRISVVVGLLVP